MLKLRDDAKTMTGEEIQMTFYGLVVSDTGGDEKHFEKNIA